MFGDYDIRLEQAEFKEINMSAHSEGNCVVVIQSNRGGSKVAKYVCTQVLVLTPYK